RNSSVYCLLLPINTSVIAMNYGVRMSTKGWSVHGAATGLEQAHGDQVDHQADRGNDHHAGRGHFRWLAEATHGFPQDVAGHDEEQAAIDHRANALHPRITIRAFGVRRST